MESSNKLTHHRRKCAFGCIPLPGPYHRFPHPKNQPDRFIEWINIVCDNLAADDPNILKLVNEDPEKIYNNKSVCDYHFKCEDMTAGHRLIWNAVPTLCLKGIKKMPPLQVQSEHNYGVTRGPQNTNPIVYKSKNETLQKHLNLKPDTDRSVNKISKDAWDDEVDVSMYSDDEDIVEDVKIATPTPTLENVVEVDGDNKNMLHEGFLCNVCNVPIIGYRYTCVQCSDYDLCGACEARGAHCMHYVLRIPTPRPFGEIKSLLDIIKENLSLPDPVSNETITHFVDEVETEFLEEDTYSVLITDDNVEDNADNNEPDVPECLDNTQHPVNQNPSVEFVDTATDRRSKFKRTYERQKDLKVPVRLNTLDLGQRFYDDPSSDFVDAYARHQMRVINEKYKDTNAHKTLDNIEDTHTVHKEAQSVKSVDISNKPHKITKKPRTYCTIPASHMATKHDQNIHEQNIKVLEICDRIGKVVRTKPNAVKVISFESSVRKSRKESEKQKLIHVITHATRLKKKKKELKKEVQVNVTRLNKEELDAALKRFRNSYKS